MSEIIEYELDGHDRSRALEMQARGATLEDIADTLQRPIGLIEAVVRAANRVMVSKSPEDREAEAGRHLNILDRVVREMLDAWEKSKQTVEEVKETIYEGETDSGQEIVIRRKIEKRFVPTVGDPRFIKELRGTMKDIRRIHRILESQPEDSGIGAEGPSVITVEVLQPNPVPVNDDE